MLLVVLEHDGGRLVEAAREALTFGRRLADRLDVPLEAALIGADAPEIVDDAHRCGATRVHVATHEVLTDYGPDAFGEVVVQLARALEPEVVLASGSDRGNETMAHAAARLEAPFVSNCTDVEPGETWVITRVQWGGSLLEDILLDADADAALLTCAPHVVAATPLSGEPAAGGPTTPVMFDPVLDESHTVTMVRDRTVQEAGVTLPTAPVVCGGGRGVGSEAGFAPLEELAELLGGRVGCSRAVTNLGWRPHADQVGQTGTRIAPELYIASGISGAIQHWVGAMASKHILAINIDPQANMVVKADWAVIADLHEMIPAINAEIRRRRAGGGDGLA